MADEATAEESSTIEVQKVPKSWVRAARKASAELAKNSRILESTAPSGLASDKTLKKRAYLSGPQGGEDLSPQRVFQLNPKRK